MAVPIQTIDPDGSGGDGGSGSSSPPSGGGSTPAATPAPGSKLGVIVTGSNYTFTSDQIAAAGGPWPSFKVRVTPLNASGAGPAAEVPYPPT